MNDDFKMEAKKQYIKYFRFWFILVFLMLILTVVIGIRNFRKPVIERANLSAPTERVYDYADILTAEEEEKLRNYIAEKEKTYQIDFVIVTTSIEVEGAEAQAEYGYRFTDWERNMRDLADDFWDENGYGYNQSFEGDGSLLLDNRYPGQRGEWLSTSGKVERKLSGSRVENVLYAVDEYYDSDPYQAYIAYIDEVCSYMKVFGTTGSFLVFYLVAFLVITVIAIVYACSHLHQEPAKDTAAVNCYVAGGKPVMNNLNDALIRKNVVKRRIQTSSGSGGGGGGHHTSRSGASHGGGGHRH